MTFKSYLTAELLDFDGTTVITGALSDVWGITGSDPQSDCGFASVNLQLSDPDADEVRSGRFVRLSTNGTEFFTFKIEGHPEYHQVDTGDEIQQYLTASGRGNGCIFDEAITQPEPLLVGVDLDTSWRIWSFASINFPNSTTWDDPTELYEYFDGVTYGVRVIAIETDPDTETVELFPAPVAFPWPNAIKNGNDAAPTPTYEPTYWVRADGAAEDDVGFDFFRGGFLLAGEQQVSFFITADNLFTLFLDGVPIIGEADDQMMWEGYKDITLNLPAGFHTIGISTENIDVDVPYNAGGLLFNAIAIAVYPGDVETSLTLNLLSSNAADWASFYSPDEWPGWTPGQIIQDWIDEVQTRGALTQFGSTTFTDFADTASGDWDSLDPDTETEFIPTWSMKVGSSGLDLLNELFVQGWIDWHMTPDFDLDVWAAGTRGVTPAVDFEIGDIDTVGNIVSLERGESKPYANALLVQYAEGNVWVTDPSAITAYGTRVEDYYSTDAATLVDAQRLGRVELLSRRGEAKTPLLVTIEPRNQNEAPYEGLWDQGDYISVPGIDGTPANQQVLAIEWDQDEDGYAVWKVEMNARWRSPQREAVDLLRTIGGKTLGAATDHGVPKD